MALKTGITKVVSGLKWTNKDILELKDYYKNTTDENFSIHEISTKLGRSFASIALKASRLKISRSRKNPRVFTEEAKKKMSESHKKRFTPEKRKETGERIKNWHKNNKHPRGFFGKKHSESAKMSISEKNKQHKVPKDRIEKQVKTRLLRYGKICPNSIRGSWGSGWREIGGRKNFYRSKWEANYARYLDFLKNSQKIKKWEHEPDYFIFNPTRCGCVSYLPDFKVTNNDGSLEYHEVKGWWDERSKIKSMLMSEQYPNIVLKNFDGRWYKENKIRLSELVGGWEK